MTSNEWTGSSALASLVFELRMDEEAGAFDVSEKD